MSTEITIDEQLKSIQKKAFLITNMAIKLNPKTIACIFCDYAGHVDQLSLRVSESKTIYSRFIYNESLYLFSDKLFIMDDQLIRSEKKLDQMITFLKSLPLKPKTK